MPDTDLSKGKKSFHQKPRSEDNPTEPVPITDDEDPRGKQRMHKRLQVMKYASTRTI